MRVLEWRAGIAADVVIGAVSAVVLAFYGYRIGASWGGAYWVSGCTAGAAVCALALVRRRSRLWTAFAGMGVAAAAIVVARVAHLPTEPGPGVTFGLSVLVGSAVRVLPPRPACAVAGGGLVVVAGAFAAGSQAAVGTMSAVGWAGAVVAGLWPRLLASRRRAVEERVRRGERMELARELHDVVAHHVTCVVLQAQTARLLAHKQPERLATSLADIETAGSDALAATRRVVGLLRDPARGLPSLDGLDELVRRFGGHGPAVRLRLPEGEDTSLWPPEVATTVYRIVQESLTNVSRHAPQARSVTVTVTRARSSVTVEVADDAPPAPARRLRRSGYGGSGGYGLVGMRERVEALGGTLRAGPSPGAGWSVVAALPVPAREHP
ncbi:sensor histidine kinase [Nonomuraea sp. NPDC051941]|uniref:sensor histidine kinase n=1 Tax=Nonomuraea sp. NPDC051941 TaxID=3364373 RepID=UPI0037C7098A